MLIHLEGIEGAGKTTHLRLLADLLRKKRYPIVTETKEPGWGGDHLSGIFKHLIGRSDITPVEKLFLLLADRTGHYARLIRPVLNDKNYRPIILCERGPDSTVAYQGFGMNLLPPSMINTLNLNATGGVLSTLTIVLDCETPIATQRSTRANQIDLSNQKIRDYYDRVRDGYRSIVEYDPNRYFVVNSAQAIEEVHSQIWGAVSKFLNV